MVGMVGMAAMVGTMVMSPSGTSPWHGEAMVGMVGMEAMEAMEAWWQ
jgi:hypothetical protein